VNPRGSVPVVAAGATPLDAILERRIVLLPDRHVADRDAKFLCR
jgi:hypothetical protein